MAMGCLVGLIPSAGPDISSFLALLPRPGQMGASRGCSELFRTAVHLGLTFLVVRVACDVDCLQPLVAPSVSPCSAFRAVASRGLVMPPSRVLVRHLG